MSFWDGVSWCQNTHGLNLVSIHSAEENEAVRVALGGISAWIGFSDIDVEGLWGWTDNSGASYSNWNNGEPNNHGNNEHCAEFLSNPSGLWNDAPCDHDRRVVCGSFQ